MDKPGEAKPMKITPELLRRWKVPYCIGSVNSRRSFIRVRIIEAWLDEVGFERINDDYSDANMEHHWRAYEAEFSSGVRLEVFAGAVGQYRRWLASGYPPTRPLDEGAVARTPKATKPKPQAQVAKPKIEVPKTTVRVEAKRKRKFKPTTMRMTTEMETT